MLKLKKLLFVFLFACAFASAASSQAPRGNAEQLRQDEINRQRRNRDLDDRSDNLHAMMQESLSRDQAALMRSHSGMQKPLTKEEKARINKILAPDAADAAKYKDFLRQKNTGLFRLFPDLGCDSEKNLVRVDGNCADAVSGSWHYSFRQKDYYSPEFFDVKFKDGNLISRGFLSQELLVNLGDVSLDDVSPAASGVKFLLDFEPQVKIEDAKKQLAEITKGVEAAGYKYTNSLKADLNTTYALRVVAYRNDNKTINRLSPLTSKEDFKFFVLNADKRIDLTIAFRVVRRDENGSITILWKELNRRDAPKLIFNKNEKLSDIKPKI